jgi:hypothetical protein
MAASSNWQALDRLEHPQVILFHMKNMNDEIKEIFKEEFINNEKKGASVEDKIFCYFLCICKLKTLLFPFLPYETQLTMNEIYKRAKLRLRAMPSDRPGQLDLFDDFFDMEERLMVAAKANGFLMKQVSQRNQAGEFVDIDEDEEA